MMNVDDLRRKIEREMRYAMKEIAALAKVYPLLDENDQRPVAIRFQKSFVAQLKRFDPIWAAGNREKAFAMAALLAEQIRRRPRRRR